MSLEALKAKHQRLAKTNKLKSKLGVQPNNPKHAPNPIPFMSNPNHFLLIRSLLPSAKVAPLQVASNGRLSYMGQILHQLGLPTLGKEGKQVYTINDVVSMRVHQPFTQLCAGRVVQTDLATSIINTHPENEVRLRTLLTDAGFTVEFIDS